MRRALLALGLLAAAAAGPALAEEGELPPRWRRRPPPAAPEGGRARPAPYERLGLDPYRVEFPSLPRVIYRQEALDWWVRAENRTAQPFEGEIGIVLRRGDEEAFRASERVRIPPAETVRSRHPADEVDRDKWQIPFDELRRLGVPLDRRDPPAPIVAREAAARWPIRAAFGRGTRGALEAVLRDESGKVLATRRAILKPLEEGIAGLGVEDGFLREPRAPDPGPGAVADPVVLLADLEDPMKREEWKVVRWAGRRLGRAGGDRALVLADDRRPLAGPGLKEALAAATPSGKSLTLVPPPDGPAPLYRGLPDLDRALQAGDADIAILVPPAGMLDDPAPAWEVERLWHVAIERARAAGCKIVLATPVPAPAARDAERVHAAIVRKVAAAHDLPVLDLSEALPDADIARLYESAPGAGVLARDPNPEGLKRLAAAIAERAFR